jgi:hypothetical protein
MDAIKDILSTSTKKMLLQLFLISTLLLAPVLSYELGQGIPAIKLLSLSALIVSAAISYLTVLLFALGGLCLIGPLAELHNKGAVNPPIRTESKFTKYLAITSTYVVLGSLLFFTIDNMAPAIGWAGALFTTWIAALFSFWGWILKSNYEKENSLSLQDDSQPFENLKFDLHGMPLKDVKFELSVTPPTAPKGIKPVEKIFWVMFLFAACGAAMGIATQVLAPLGKFSLRFSNMGGELPVEVKADDSSGLQRASLILETSDGWYLRIDKDCEELSWIKADDLKSAKRLYKRDANGRNLGACQMESK